MFTLEEKHLRKLCEMNHFPFPENELLIMGLRGCLPLIEDDHAFRNAHQLEEQHITYQTPKCTLLQWYPAQGFSVYAGSTVPHMSSMESAKEKGGQGANRMITCRLDRYYYKGQHKAGASTGHDALRTDKLLPVRRTQDDLDYDNLDEVDLEQARPQYDNIHAGWCGGLNKRYASAGCQVLMGYPKCESRGNSPATGPWAAFIDSVYNGKGKNQQKFTYILLEARDARKVAYACDEAMVSRLRFGSQGETVLAAQKALQAGGFYNYALDGDFGFKTLSALLDYQSKYFGENGDDGIVGPQTATQMGISLPKV